MGAVNDWVARHQPTLERLIYAIDQLRFAVRRSADELTNRGDWGGIDVAVDAAREEVAQAALAVGNLPTPPDAVMQQELAAFLRAVTEFNNPPSINAWVRTWVTAMEHWDAFFDALADRSGVTPPPRSS